MKKMVLMLVGALCTLGATAQAPQTAKTEIMKMKTADGQVIRYEVNNVQELSFGSLYHAFNGYTLATTNYFTDLYSGGTTNLAVYQATEGYDVHFSDPIWGEADFENCFSKGQLSGTGTITLGQQYGFKKYEATLSGAMNAPVITIASLMQGTTLKFYMGDVPQAVVISGSHKGNMSVMVGDNFGPYENNSVTHQITANADGTINVVIPEYTLDNTAIGNLTLGTYTVRNIAYDQEKDTFYRDYKDDGLTFHFKAVGSTTIDGDYLFKNLGNITVKKTEAGISIINNFKPTRADGGGMPMNISASFTEAQSGNPHQ